MEIFGVLESHIQISDYEAWKSPMGGTCASVVGWLSTLSINWDAWSAIGTILATIVALFLPMHMAKREWARQDDIRTADADAARQELAGMQHEICSAVDRVLAYRDGAIAIFDSKPVYHVGLQAIKRINLNAHILLDVLNILRQRSELSDGAVYSAVAATKVASAIVDETGKVLRNWGTVDPGWPERKAALLELNELADMAQLRADGVRRYYGLQPGKSAAEIKAKYLPLAEAIRAAIAGDSGEPPNNLAVSYH